MVRKLLIVAFVIGLILVIVGTMSALTFDPFRDDVLDGSEFVPPQVTHTFDDIFDDPELVLDVTCPTGHAINFDFDIGASCVNVETNILLQCDEEFVNEFGIIETVQCVVRSLQ